MENIEIIPLVGIKWNAKSIALSSSREEVRNLLGVPCKEWKNAWYYFNNELRFDFDEKGELEFIEFLGGIDGEVQPEIYGAAAFKTEAEELYHILLEKNNGSAGDNENGYSYVFQNISVGVFREAVPESVHEMIEEARAEGVSMSAADIEYEMRKANHWATIGIGIKGYYG